MTLAAARRVSQFSDDVASAARLTEPDANSGIVSVTAGTRPTTRCVGTRSKTETRRAEVVLSSRCRATEYQGPVPAARAAGGPSRTTQSKGLAQLGSPSPSHVATSSPMLAGGPCARQNLNHGRLARTQAMSERDQTGCREATARSGGCWLRNEQARRRWCRTPDGPPPPGPKSYKTSRQRNLTPEMPSRSSQPRRRVQLGLPSPPPAMVSSPLLAGGPRPLQRSACKRGRA